MKTQSRRTMLRSLALSIGVGTAGCSSLLSRGTVNVVVVNNRETEQAVDVLVTDDADEVVFQQTITVAAGGHTTIESAFEGGTSQAKIRVGESTTSAEITMNGCETQDFVVSLGPQQVNVSLSDC